MSYFQSCAAVGLVTRRSSLGLVGKSRTPGKKTENNLSGKIARDELGEYSTLKILFCQYLQHQGSPWMYSLRNKFG